MGYNPTLPSQDGPGGACPGGAGTGACLKPLHNPPIGEAVWPSLPQPIATGLNFPTSVTICTGRDCPTPP